ncbi:MAG: hypothetical protein AABX04_07000 [Nanoarchaeota archaeon]
MNRLYLVATAALAFVLTCFCPQPPKRESIPSPLEERVSNPPEEKVYPYSAPPIPSNILPNPSNLYSFLPPPYGAIQCHYLRPAMEGEEDFILRTMESAVGPGKREVIPPQGCALGALDIKDPEMQRDYVKACAISGMRYGGTKLVIHFSEGSTLNSCSEITMEFMPRSSPFGLPFNHSRSPSFP